MKKSRREKAIQELKALNEIITKVTIQVQGLEDKIGFESMVGRRIANTVYQMEQDLSKYMEMYNNKEID